MDLYMKNFVKVHQKIRFLGGIHEKTIYVGEFPKKGVLNSF